MFKDPAWFPEPKDPAWFPDGSNTWTRLFPLSATYTFPESSTAMPDGPLNWPSPRPGPPMVAAWFPDGSNTWTRPLPVSATYMAPVEPSTATPTG